jgi:hypothetical protein
MLLSFAPPTSSLFATSFAFGAFLLPASQMTLWNHESADRNDRVRPSIPDSGGAYYGGCAAGTTIGEAVSVDTRLAPGGGGRPKGGVPNRAGSAAV